MSASKADIKADIQRDVDRDEPIGAMEPMIVGESSPHRGEIVDLSLDLAAKAAGFRRSLHRAPE